MNLIIIKYNKITSSCISNNFVLKIQETNLEELQRKVDFFLNEIFTSKIQTIPIDTNYKKESDTMYFSYVPIIFKNSVFYM